VLAQSAELAEAHAIPQWHAEAQDALLRLGHLRHRVDDLFGHKAGNAIKAFRVQRDDRGSGSVTTGQKQQALFDALKEKVAAVPALSLPASSSKISGIPNRRTDASFPSAFAASNVIESYIQGKGGCGFLRSTESWKEVGSGNTRPFDKDVIEWSEADYDALRKSYVRCLNPGFDATASAKIFEERYIRLIREAQQEAIVRVQQQKKAVEESRQKNDEIASLRSKLAKRIEVLAALIKGTREEVLNFESRSRDLIFNNIDSAVIQSGTLVEAKVKQAETERTELEPDLQPWAAKSKPHKFRIAPL
jgi:hypothetical protein